MFPKPKLLNLLKYNLAQWIVSLTNGNWFDQ